MLLLWVSNCLCLPPLSFWTERPCPAGHPVGEDAVEESNGDCKSADPPENPLVHAGIVARPELDPEDDHAEEEGDVELEDGGAELDIDDETGDETVVEEGEDGEEDGGGDAVADLVGGGQEDEQELAHVAALVAVLPVEQVEEGAEEVAEDESAENGGKDEPFEDRGNLLHLHSPHLGTTNTVDLAHPSLPRSPWNRSVWQNGRHDIQDEETLAPYWERAASMVRPK